MLIFIYSSISWLLTFENLNNLTVCFFFPADLCVQILIL